MIVAIMELNIQDFEREVVQAGGAVLVDFGAEWCHPCKQLDPIVEELAKAWDGKVKVMKVDIDANADTAMKYGVMGVPTLILFVDGEPVERLTGYVPKKRIEETFLPFLS